MPYRSNETAPRVHAGWRVLSHARWILIACSLTLHFALADPALDIRLQDAVWAGDSGLVSNLLQQGANPNSLDYRHGPELPPLASASSKGNLEIIDLLLEAGADPNLKDNLNWTPLFWAVSSKNWAAAERLLTVPNLELFNIDTFNKMILDYLVEAKQDHLLKRVQNQIASMKQAMSPEYYIVVNFLGQGGGGRVEDRTIRRHRRVDKVITMERILFERSRNEAEFEKIKSLITKWMAFDRTRLGPRNHSLMIVGSSWGSVHANALAKWFVGEFGIRSRLLILNDGANLLGFPVKRIGPAEQTINYHVEGIKWPRGSSIHDAQVNISFGDVEHSTGLTIGAGRAEEEILRVLDMNPIRCEQLIE